jgi:hypothetical protein
VWSANHELVMHLAESSGTVARDSSGKGRNGAWTGPGSTVFGQAGPADGAVRITNRSRYLKVNGAALTLGAEWSLSAWYRDLWSAAVPRTLAESSTGDRLLYLPQGSTNAAAFVGGLSWDSGYVLASPTGVWQQVWAVARGGKTVVYHNGREVGQCPTNAQGTVVKLLNYSGTAQNWSAYADELRVDSVARSSNWVWACWQTAAASDAFAVCGAAEDHHPAALVPDADGDGMPDEWEAAHFPQGAAALPDADADADGMQNLAEYVAGTDPTNSASYFGLWLSPLSGGVGVVGFFGIEGVEGRRLYSLEDATNLLAPAWRGVPDFTNLPGAGRAILFTNPPAAPGPRVFRGKVWQEGK